MAREFGLLASRGSDFHGPLESKIDLGKLPLLDASLPNVMQVLLERRLRAFNVSHSSRVSAPAA